MILIRDIRLPLSAGEQQAYEKALHLARIPRSRVSHLGIAKQIGRASCRERV